MYNKVKRYHIDLNKDESQRWRHVIEQETPALKALAEEVKSDMAGYSSIALSPVLHQLFSLVYKIGGGLYRGEMKSFAKAMGISHALVTVMNCTYELSQAGEFSTPFGCTAGVKWLPDVGMIHVRNMDWPLRTIGKGTRLFQFEEDGRTFVSVGVVGHVGVLSGMVPGAYSVTINWAPPNERVRLNWGPSFLLREVLRTCNTYEEAVQELSSTSLSTPVFYTVCGTKKSQACVIERTPDLSGVRKIKNGLLVQSNHYQKRDFHKFNGPLYKEDEDGANVYNDSYDRYSTMHDTLEDADTVTEVVACLDKEPVYNENSYQQMVFRPESGEVKAWRWT